MLRTNFQMVKDLYKKLKPVNRGVLTGEEVSIIREDLCLKDMNLLQLRNLRDFVVLYSSVQVDKDSTSPDEVMYNMDKCSGICAVIDDEIFNKGGEV